MKNCKKDILKVAKVFSRVKKFLLMEKNVKTTKITEVNKEMKKQALENVPDIKDIKVEVKKSDFSKEYKTPNPLKMRIIFHGLNFLFVALVITGGPNKPNNPDKPPLDRWIEKLMEFYHLWPPKQWFWSLLGLVVLYAITGYLYNRWLRKTMRGHWLSIKARIYLIIFDLISNLGLGLYYLDHRDTIMGEIMMRCPIAISPVIFAIELLVVSWYYFYNYYLPFMPAFISFREKRNKNKYWLLWKRFKKAVQDFVEKIS